MSQTHRKSISCDKKIACSLVAFILSLPVTGEELKPTVTAHANKTPVVIETQVKGSQEQPKVIYIMPWQGIETPVIIDTDNPKITLPNFKPINPKQFKQQSALFYKLHLNSEIEN